MRVDSECDNPQRTERRIAGPRICTPPLLFVFLFLLLASSMNVAVEDLIGERLS